MTYFKTALLSAAAIAMAAPAFADGHKEMKKDTMVKAKTSATMSADELAMMKKKQMEAMRQKQMESMKMTTTTTMETESTTVMHTGDMHADKTGMKKMKHDGMHPSKVNDTVGEILQADGEPSIQSDQEIIVEDYTIEDDAFRAADDDGMIKDNAIVVPGSNGAITTVTCPAGTTAQPDMTCMITGDYSPDLNG